MEIETHKMLALSTAHVPGEAEVDAMKMNVVVYDKPAYGWFIPIVEQSKPPEWLMPLWRFAKDQGCTWLMLDRDAERIEGLPFWEW